MVKIYKTIQGNLTQINDIEQGCWVDIAEPIGVEIVDLSKRLDVPLDFFTSPLDIDERARIETDNGRTLIITRVPQMNIKDPKVPFITLPLGIIIKEDCVITICAMKSDVIKNLVTEKSNKISTVDQTQLVLAIFSETALLFLKYLKEINVQIDKLEEQLHSALENKSLVALLSIAKSLVFFTTSLKSNDIMTVKLLGISSLNITGENKSLYEDIVIDNLQAIDMANVYTEILSSMMDAFASVISNNLNVVMKFLTLITVLIAFPTLVSSIYGMNLKLPLQSHPLAFEITMGISFGIALLVAIFFIRRKWL